MDYRVSFLIECSSSKSSNALKDMLQGKEGEIRNLRKKVEGGNPKKVVRDGFS